MLARLSEVVGETLLTLNGWIGPSRCRGGLFYGSRSLTRARLLNESLLK